MGSEWSSVSPNLSKRNKTPTSLIPEEPIELSEDEQREYDRQIQELADPRFHDSGKCGEPLTLRVTLKTTTRLNGVIKGHYIRRKFCPVHQIEVDLSGWEVGFYEGEKSTLKKPKRPKK